MDSGATKKLIKLFYETPRAQEIYTTLQREREAQRGRANIEPFFTDIPKEVEEKVTSLTKVTEKNVDDAPDKGRRVHVDKFPCNCDDSMLTETAVSDICDSKVSEAFQKDEKFDSGVQKEQKQRELLKWSLKIVDNKEIIVEGQRSGDPPDINWRTSVIRDRISTNVVRSRKGTLYFLLGEIDKSDMIQKGFSEEIINMFNYGFPPNWRDVFLKVAPSNKRAKKSTLCHWISDKKPSVSVMTNDTAKKKVDEEMNVVPDIDNEAPWQADKSPSSVSPKNKPKTKVASTSSGPPRRSRKKKSKSPNTTGTDDIREIEVQRSRSGRLICPALDYWRGQRINSFGDDGEISIIKSNLEEDSKLTLVETSKSSSDLLQVPMISSSAPSGTDTDWVPDDSSKTDSTESRTINLREAKNTQRISFLKTTLLRGESQSDGSSSMDSVVRKQKESTGRKKPAARKTSTMETLRNGNKSEKQTESDTNDSFQISSSSERSESERTTKNARANARQGENLITRKSRSKMKKTYPLKTSTRVEETTDSDNPAADQQIDLHSFDDSERQIINVKRSSIANSLRPARTHFKARNEANADFVKPAKSKSEELLKEPIGDGQPQNSKKLKVQTGKLTSKKGTLARKRELRVMLEQQDEGYEDDAFEGTPFRSHKHSRMHSVSPINIDNSDDVPDEVSDNDLKTPSSKTPTNRLRPAGPLSTVKSGVDNMTPGLLNTVNRDDVDRYVNQLKRQKLRNKHKKIDPRTPLTKKKVNDIMTDGVDYSFNIHKLTTIEDEEDKDFYWSDE